MLILLCDDEPMVHIGLKCMISEMHPGRHRFVEAANGRELIAQAQAQPDLAFVDIQMPLMDGLSAIEQAKRISPGTKWFMLTGHSQFSYAQKAVRLGVSDYLLKPVGMAELGEVMNKVENWKQSDRTAANRRFQLEMMALFHQYQMFGQETGLPIEDGSSEYALALFYIDSSHKDARTGISRELEGSLTQLLAASSLDYAMFHLSTSEFCLVTRGQQTLDDRLIHGLASPERWISAVYATGLLSRQSLLDACGRIMALANLRMVWSFGQGYDLESLERLADRDGLLTFAGLIDTICLSFLDKDEISYKNALTELWGVSHSLYARIDLAALGAYLNAVIGLEPDTASLQGLAVQLGTLADDMYLQASNKNSPNAISQVKLYIQKHYMDDISVNSFADLLDITPSYLSRIFHKQTGVKFIDYLSEIRVSAAKRLLREHPDMTIKEVAERVGYFSSKYFTKVFYKLTEMHPSEYQKRAGRADGGFAVHDKIAPKGY